MSLTPRQRTTILPMLALLLALGGMTAIVSSFANDARAAVTHGELVPELARRELPVTVDGRVRAHAQVGNRIFVGGDFTQVSLPDGTIIDQAYIYAYDINTGAFDPNFRPVLNNEVEALETSETGDGLYVGGRFTRWEEGTVRSFPLRVAKLDADGSLDRNFNGRASAVVKTLEHVGGYLYLGGDFQTVSDQPIVGFARVDDETGLLDPTLNLDLADSVAFGQFVRTIESNPNGNELFVLHYAEQVAGETREAVFKLDISTPTPVLSGWTIPWVDQAGRGVCWRQLRDLAISPDGSFIVIGGQGADRPPNCDSVVRYETAGDALVEFTWSARMYSSIFSLAVSDVAVYAGGHFCAAPRLGAVYEGGLTSNSVLTANVCFVGEPDHLSNPSSIDPENAVFRNQLAALDPATARALEWDPGSNNSLGVFDLTLIDRGLLAGHDGDRFSTFLVGGSGFFDFGAPADVEVPEISVTDPAANSVASALTEINGVATDDREIQNIVVRLFNRTEDLWVQLDGTLGAERVDLPVQATETGLREVSWTVGVANLVPGEYEVRGFVIDSSSNTSPGLEHQFLVPGAAVCSVALDDSNQPVVTYSGFDADGVDTVFLRRNGGFLSAAPAGAASFTDSAAAPGDQSYAVRWRPAEGQTDVACTPSPITVPEASFACQVSVDPNGNPVLTWTDVGLATYVVREANLGFVASVSGANVFTDTERAPGDYSYVIRLRGNGATTDEPCSPSPVTVPDRGDVPVANSCTASADANGVVTLQWSAIEGENAYTVRDNDGFVATVRDELGFVDTGATSGERAYVIRSRNAGVTTDVVCNSIVVP